MEQPVRRGTAEDCMQDAMQNVARDVAQDHLRDTTQGGARDATRLWAGSRPWLIAVGALYRTALMLLGVDLLVTLAFGPLPMAGHAMAVLAGAILFSTLARARDFVASA